MATAATQGWFDACDFVALHSSNLPRWVRGERGSVAARAAAGLPPLTLRIDGGEAFTYAVGPDARITVAPGSDGAATEVVLADAAWQQLFHEVRTAAGLLYAGALRVVRGNPLDLVLWEPALRALWSARPLFDEGNADLRAPDGAALDPLTSYDPDTDDSVLAAYLAEAGYVRVRSVFSPDETEALRRETDRLRSETVEERRRSGRADGRSWWAAGVDGDDVLARITYAGERSETLAGLLDDARVRRLGSLAGVALEVARDRIDGVTVLFKNAKVSEGLSDLPWHRDCGLGGHSVMCPLLIVGVHLTDMNAATGELRVKPGSWRGSLPAREALEARPGDGVGLEARAGDCTVHYGDLFHAAPPPRGDAGPYRTTVYLTFMPPRAFELIGPGEAYNDLVLGGEDGRVEDLRTRASGH